MSPLTADVRDVVLRDGSTLRLRAPTGEDADAIAAFLRALSPDSLFMRFHGGVAVEPRLVTPVLDPDWVERGALVGITGEGADELFAATADAE